MSESRLPILRRPLVLALAGLLATAAVVWAVVALLQVDFRQQSNLVNVSIRAQVKPPEAVIAGFVIARHTQTVVVRALGPSLAAQKVTDVLPQPRLRIVRNQDGVELARNEGWRVSGSPRLLADLAPYAPGDPRDAVCVVTLPAGMYSAVIESRDGQPGTAMLEIFVLLD